MSNNQDPIDRLVRAALEVDPAPGFESRIRRHVQQQAIAPRRRVSPFLAFSGAAAAVLIFLLLSVPRNQSRDVAVSSPPVSRIESRPVSEPEAIVSKATEKTSKLNPLTSPQPVLVERALDVPGLSVPEHRVNALELAPLANFSVADSVNPLPQMALHPIGIQPLQLDSWSPNEGGTE